MQPRQHLRRSIHRIAVLALFAAAACGRDGDEARGASTPGSGSDAASGGAATTTTSSSSSSASDEAFAFTDADLQAYERGLTKEIELVRAAQDRQRTATTPEARGEAMQAQWEDQTIPEGARSAGLAVDRYRKVRQTVNRTLQTLDFQGKIEGPMSMDTTNAPPDMRRRLASDPFAELAPSSAAALRARMDRLVPLFVRYVELTAVAG